MTSMARFKISLANKNQKAGDKCWTNKAANPNFPPITSFQTLHKINQINIGWRVMSIVLLSDVIERDLGQRVTVVSTSPKIKRPKGAPKRGQLIRLPLRFCHKLRKSGNTQPLFISARPTVLPFAYTSVVQ